MKKGFDLWVLKKKILCLMHDHISFSLDMHNQILDSTSRDKTPTVTLHVTVSWVCFNCMFKTEQEVLLISPASKHKRVCCPPLLMVGFLKKIIQE